jgi:hypothetical protein
MSRASTDAELLEMRSNPRDKPEDDVKQAALPELENSERNRADENEGGDGDCQMGSGLPAAEHRVAVGKRSCLNIRMPHDLSSRLCHQSSGDD